MRLSLKITGLLTLFIMLCVIVCAFYMDQTDVKPPARLSSCLEESGPAREKAQSLIDSDTTLKRILTAELKKRDTVKP